MSEKVYKYFLLFLILLGIVGVVYPYNPMVFWDQCVYLLHAKFFAGVDISYSELSFRSPLLSIISIPIVWFTHNVLPYKVFSILWAFTLPMATLFAFKRVVNTKKDKIFLTALILMNGSLQYEAKFFLTDIPSLVLLLVSIGFLYKKTPNSIYMAGIFCGLGILMRYGNLGLLPLWAYLLHRDFPRKDILRFAASFFLTLLPYQFWITVKYGNPVHNFNQARLEGMRNAQYSFMKFVQLYRVLGAGTVILAMLGFIKRKNWEYILGFFFLFIIVPYNKENYRFLIMLIPLTYLGVNFLINDLKKTWKYITLLLIFSELFYTNYYWRQKLIYIKPDIKSRPQFISERILEKYSHITHIATSDKYPAIAYFTGKRVVPLSRTYATSGEFKYVDKAALKNRKAIVITGWNSFPSRDYLENNKFFKFLEKYKGVYLYEYLGGMKPGFRQYSAVRLLNNFYYGYNSKGFVEFDQKNHVTQLLFKYKVSPDFIVDNKLEQCNLSEIISFEDLKTIQIINHINDKLTLQITPEKIGDCVNKSKIYFRINYELVKEFD